MNPTTSTARRTVLQGTAALLAGALPRSVQAVKNAGVKLD